LGFEEHVTYPADVHQYLSPNDNKLHGCKAKWYQGYYEEEGEVEHSLRLMKLLDEETVANSKRYFDNNLIKVKKSDLDAMLGE